MYRLATILLIGSAAALSLEKNETVNMAQVNATYEPADCEAECWYHMMDKRVACFEDSLANYCIKVCTVEENGNWYCN